MENEKQSLLNLITQAAQQQTISKNELIAAYEQGLKNPHSQSLSKAISLVEVFSLLGGLIVFLGIAILVSEHWQNLTAVNKVLITLGSGLAAHIVGIIFEKDSRVKIIGMSFFLISALLIPFGIAVTMNISGYDVNTNASVSFISAMSLAIFMLTYAAFKMDIHLLFSILYGTWLFYALAGLLHPNGSNDFYLYCTLVAGSSYLFLGRYVEEYTESALAGFLHCFGIVAVLGALFGFDLLHKGSIWEWMFPFAVLLVIYLSVQIRSKSFLTFGSLFLVAYLLVVTDRYFSMSIGWPLALVLMGFLFMLVAYFYFQVKKKYFNK